MGEPAIETIDVLKNGGVAVEPSGKGKMARQIAGASVMKRILAVLGTCLFLLPIAFAQDFFELVETGTPEHVQAAMMKVQK